MDRAAGQEMERERRVKYKIEASPLWKGPRPDVTILGTMKVLLRPVILPVTILWNASIVHWFRVTIYLQCLLQFYCWSRSLMAAWLLLL